ELPFKVTLFGGRLPRLQQSQREGLSTSLAKRIAERFDTVRRGLGGMVALSGGGGTRMVYRLVRRTGFNRLLPSAWRESQREATDERLSKVLPLTVGVPSEDDGGGSG